MNGEESIFISQGTVNCCCIPVMSPSNKAEKQRAKFLTTSNLKKNPNTTAYISLHKKYVFL